MPATVAACAHGGMGGRTVVRMVVAAGNKVCAAHTGGAKSVPSQCTWRIQVSTAPRGYDAAGCGTVHSMVCCFCFRWLARGCDSAHPDVVAAVGQQPVRGGELLAHAVAKVVERVSVVPPRRHDVVTTLPGAKNASKTRGRSL